MPVFTLEPPSNRATTRPLVGQANFGAGSDGGGGTVRFGAGDARDGALATLPPDGGVSRMT